MHIPYFTVIFTYLHNIAMQDLCAYCEGTSVSWGLAPLILNLVTRWRWQARFILQLLLSLWKCLYYQHSRRLVDHRAGLNALWNRIVNPCRALNTDFLLVRPVAKKYSKLSYLCGMFVVYMVVLNNGDVLCFLWCISWRQWSMIGSKSIASGHIGMIALQMCHKCNNVQTFPVVL
jgi:hypothetical protein